MSPLSQYSHYEWHLGCPFLQMQRQDLLSRMLLGCWHPPYLHSPHHTPSRAINTWSGLSGWVAYPLQTSRGTIYFCLQTGGLTLKYVQAQLKVSMKNCPIAFVDVVKVCMNYKSLITCEKLCTCVKSVHGVASSICSHPPKNVDVLAQHHSWVGCYSWWDVSFGLHFLPLYAPFKQ